MHRLLKPTCRTEPGSNAGCIFARLHMTVGVVALAGACAVVPAFAQDAAAPKVRSTAKLNPATDTATAVAVEMPACLAALKLSQPQQAQAEAIIRKYDAKLDLVWRQFGEKYLETVRTEVTLLAAVEDNLTETQRTQVREQRRQMAHADKKMAGTTSRSNQADTKATDAVAGELTGAGITLTEEQETAADDIHQKYAGHLRSLNRNIQGIHMRLVSLEADKLVELEKLLTPEQLAQLREVRQTMSGGPKITAAQKVSTKTE